MSDTDPIAAATRRLAQNPRDVLALIDRAEAFMARHEAAAALEDAELCLRIALAEPKLQGELRGILLARLYTLHSRALGGLGDWARALAPAEQALRERPNDVDALVQRGRIRREMGNPQGALQDFEAALRLDGRSTTAYVGRGLARYAMQDYAGALADYDQALGIDQTLAVAWSNRGNAYLRLNNLAQAESDYRTALDLDPFLVRAYDALAEVLARRKALDEALSVITRGLEQYPHDADLLLRAAAIYDERHQLPEALDALNLAVQHAPDNAPAYALRGQVHGRSGDYPAAIADLSRAVQLNPADAETHFNLALAHWYADNPRAALESLDRVLELERDDVEARAWHDRIMRAVQPSQAEEYLARGEVDRALAEWERELDAARQAGDREGEIELLLRSGSHYVNAGQARKGEEHLRAAFDLARQTGNPRAEAQAHVELAYIAYARQDVQQAVEHFDQVLQIGRALGD